MTVWVCRAGGGWPEGEGAGILGEREAQDEDPAHPLQTGLDRKSVYVGGQGGGAGHVTELVPSLDLRF